MWSYIYYQWNSMEICDVIQVYQNTLGLIVLILGTYTLYSLLTKTNEHEVSFFSFLNDPLSFASTNITKSLYQIRNDCRLIFLTMYLHVFKGGFIATFLMLSLFRITLIWICWLRANRNPRSKLNLAEIFFLYFFWLRLKRALFTRAYDFLDTIFHWQSNLPLVQTINAKRNFNNIHLAYKPRFPRSVSHLDTPAGLNIAFYRTVPYNLMRD